MVTVVGTLTPPPVTTPDEPTEATEGAPLVHMPPETESNNVMKEPVHTCEGPVIIEGSGLTVTTTDLEQPPTVYVIVAVVGEVTGLPVTVVVAPLTGDTEATVESLVDHVPPAVPSVSVTVPPAHTIPVPEIGTGAGVTVIVL